MHSFAPYAGPLAIAVAGGVVLAHTWRTWPDVIVDFGRELYLPWRLAQGAILYTDVAHFSGPLSPYLNAGWFRLFGTSVLTLALANAALAAVLLVLLYGLLVRVAGRLAATAGCLVFLGLFACAQYTGIGNYNWICPYSHELTHGVLLAVAALWCLERYQRTRRLAWMAGVGLAVGLVVLTKAEVLLAGALATAVGVSLTLVVERPDVRRLARLLAVVAASAALPLIVTAAAFARVMPLEDVLRLPLGHWRAALRPEISGASFYRQGMGLDRTGTSLAQTAWALGAYAAVLGAAIAGAFALRRRPPLPAAPIAGVVAAGLLAWIVPPAAWIEAAPRPLVPFTAVVAGAFVVDTVRTRGDRARASRAALAAALAVFALALLGKMLLNVRIFQYGFVLAMPATVVLVVALVAWLPDAVGRAGGQAAIVRAVVLAALVVAVYSATGFAERLVATKVYEIGRGADAFLGDGRVLPVRELLAEVERRLGPEQTLAVLPEGVMVNYLARRVNPTPYYLFDRTSLALWGEEHMVAALEAAPPDYVVLLDRGGRGIRGVFGQDYDTQLAAWVAASYRPVWRVGEPFGGAGAPSAVLLRREAAHPAAGAEDESATPETSR